MSTVGFSSRAFGCATVVSLSIAASMALQGVAQAGDCNADIAGLTQKRQAYIEKLNVLSKKAQGKLDPIASCPELRGLVVSEGALLKYLQANQAWCNVPDDAVNNLKAADAKSQQFATQACNLAQQVKKQQQQQASGASGNALGVEAQKLPAGPL
jgi:hypothetical protein